MNSKELSRLYFVTCDEIQSITAQLYENPGMVYQQVEIQSITAQLYEDLHKDNGEPINNWETVIDLALDYRKGVLAEIEGIRTACEEYNESKVKL